MNEMDGRKVVEMKDEREVVNGREVLDQMYGVGD